MAAPLITNFEAMDHATLLAKLAGMRGDLVYESGDRLFAAYQKIQSAARSLELKSKDVQWQGSAAASFRAWAQQLVKSAYELAEFVRFQSSELQTLGTEISNTVNSFPPLPTEAIETLSVMKANPAALMALDPVGTTAAMQATEQTIEQERQEAIGAMRRLASTYLAVRDTIGARPRPQFHKAANVHDVDESFEDPDDFGAGVSLVSAAVTSAAGQTSLAGETSGGSVAPRSGTTATNVTPWSAHQPGLAGAPTGMGPASYLPQSASLAQLSSAPVSNPSAPVPNPSPGAAPRASAATGLDAVSPPGLSGSGGITGGTAVARGVSGSAGPQAVGGALYGSSGAGAGAASRGGLPGRVGTTASMPSPGRTTPRVDGVVGGTPRPGNSAPGDSRAGSGRAGMPMGAMGSPAPVTGGTTTRSSSGRPPLGVPGGPVGGAPRSTAPGGRREFTAGGSGLRSRDGATPQGMSSAASNGATGRPLGGILGGQAAASPDGSQRSRQRADYLEEEEETWVGRRGDTVPPVIG